MTPQFTLAHTRLILILVLALRLSATKPPVAPYAFPAWRWTQSGRAINLVTSVEFGLSGERTDFERDIQTEKWEGGRGKGEVIDGRQPCQVVGCEAPFQLDHVSGQTTSLVFATLGDQETQETQDT